MAQVRHLGYVRLLVLAFYLSAGNMWLKSLSKVHRAYDGVDDGDNDQDYRDDGKCCKRLSSRKVIRFGILLVHAYQLEEEVC